MLEELRLNPRSPGARSCGRHPGGRVFTGKAEVGLRLSTGYAEPVGRALHNAAATGGSMQEVMG
jgi:hypothetical protein